METLKVLYSEESFFKFTLIFYFYVSAVCVHNHPIVIKTIHCLFPP